MSIPGSASPLFFQTAAGAGAAAGPIKSVRFNSADTTNLNRTFAAGNRQTFTLSWWMKRCVVNESNKRIFGKSTGSQQFSIMHDSNGRLYTYFNLESPTDVSTQTFDPQHRDPSAWAHYVLAFDTTQSTDSDRIKFYYNGVQVTDFTGTPNWPTQNASFKWNNASDTYYIGGIGSYYINAYLADMYHVDGQQLDCTSFGAFDDSGVWKPAEYSGTYGTNGFHLFDFANESGVGDDSSGNDNDWTVNNITNVEANNTDGVDNISNITQVQNNGTNQTVNLANLRTMMNTSTFQDADTDNSTYGVRVSGGKKFGVKWSNLTGLTGVSVRWQRASTYDASVETTGTGITTATTSVTSSRRQDTFSTTSTTGQIVFEDVTSGSTNGFFIRAIEFKGYTGNIVYPTNAENFILPNEDQDVLFDVPTNGSQSDTGAGGEVSGNYATWNPLFGENVSLSNGNLKAESTTSGAYAIIASTMAMTSGKWYIEYHYTKNAGEFITFGISQTNRDGTEGSGVSDTAEDFGFKCWSSGFKAQTNGANQYSYSSTVSDGDILSLAFDADAGKLWVAQNGTWMTNAGGAGDPANGNNPDFSSLTYSGGYFFMAGPYGSTTSSTLEANFGARPWAYAAPSGFKALCTTNLSTPTIADGSDYFDVVLRTADTTQSKSVTGLAFSPDLLWEKVRSHTSSHYLADSVRGSTKTLSSNSTSAEATYSSFYTSFNSDGYTIGTGDFATDRTVVGWVWDAGSSTVSNTDGDITSQVRANQTAGFSIVSYTGSGTSGDTVGHGLNAAPEFILTKRRDNTGYWPVYHKQLTAGYALELDDSFAQFAGSQLYTSTAPTSSVFSVGSNAVINGDDNTYIAYCFAPVAGYSAFGKYSGNGDASNGNFVYLPFRPAFLLIKDITSTGYWYLTDSGRNPSNDGTTNYVWANTSGAEQSDYIVDLLSNGFRLLASSGNLNASGRDYVYAAFAENPFQANGGLAR